MKTNSADLLEKINEAKQEFQNNTFFLANIIKCNPYTRSIIAEVFDDSGHVLGMRLMIDYEIPDMEARVCMGQGPTYVSVFF